MDNVVRELIQPNGNSSSELDSVVSYRPGEGASAEVMGALREALSNVDNDPSKLKLETLRMLLDLAKQTNSATRGMVFDVAV